jgi:hypothetical protein
MNMYRLDPDDFRISPGEPNVARRLQWGAAWGLLLSVPYVLFAAIQYTLNGPAIAAKVHMSFLEAVLVYVAGCLLAGALVGLCLPLMKSKVGCAVVGVLGILPIAILIRIVTTTGARWEQADFVTVIVGALLLGIPMGVSFYPELARARSGDTKSGKRH